MMTKYTLVLHDDAGRLVSSRAFAFKFDGDRADPRKNRTYEEWLVATRATEMYRDAAHAVGKFPFNKDHAHAE